MHGWVNLHFSVLPAWRGAAPVQHAIIAGDEVTGASTFRLEEGLDTGPVFGMLTETIRPRDTSGDLLGRLAVAGADLLVRTLDALEDGILSPVEQSTDGVSLAPKIEVEDARVRWSHPAYAVDRRIRGCTPGAGRVDDAAGRLAARARARGRASRTSTDLAPGELRVGKRRCSSGRAGTRCGWPR